MKIVEAGPADLDALVPLFVAYLKFYRVRADRHRVRKFLRDRLRRRQSRIYLAMERGGAVGFVQLYPTFASLEMRGSWILYDLFVSPAARRRGVAKALLERARQLAVRTGAEGLTLETARDNRAAQRLYKSIGYRREQHFWRYHLKIRRKALAV